MPSLNEGSLLYMPSSLPGMSVTQAGQLLQTQDRIIKSFPEVESVFGKAGRALTATDPAPLEMFETVINLKPQDQWRPGMTQDKLIAEMDAALKFPGVANSWTMPIKARTDMLSTGIRTPIGIKVFGKDLKQIETVARDIERVVRAVPGTTSAYAERLTGGFYLDIEPDLDATGALRRRSAPSRTWSPPRSGGEMVTTTVEGRERFGVIVRYPRELRDDRPSASPSEVLIATMDGAQIPLGELARVGLSQGAPSIRTENALLSAYIYVDLRGRDIGGYVRDAQQAVADQVQFPPGTYATWSGQFEYMQRAAGDHESGHPADAGHHLPAAVPQFPPHHRIADRDVLGAVRAGRRRLADVGAELQPERRGGRRLHRAGGRCRADRRGHADLPRPRTGGARRRAQGRRRSADGGDLIDAIVEGAVERVRPKMMTVTAIIAGLLPIMWSTGTGSEVMRRIAAPMVGGMLSSTVLTLVVIPALYSLIKQRQLARKAPASAALTVEVP
jgi:Cu(I)/Ag(I) efflux system membrane protein CusA/SilA